MSYLERRALLSRHPISPEILSSQGDVVHVLGTRLDRDRDGLLVFFVGVVLLCVAAAVYFLADLLVAAAPVVVLASFVTVSCMTPYTSRRVEGQWGGASGAICEDHFRLASLDGRARGRNFAFVSGNVRGCPPISRSLSLSRAHADVYVLSKLTPSKN